MFSLQYFIFFKLNFPDISITDTSIFIQLELFKQKAGKMFCFKRNFSVSHSPNIKAIHMSPSRRIFASHCESPLKRPKLTPTNEVVQTIKLVSREKEQNNVSVEKSTVDNSPCRPKMESYIERLKKEKRIHHQYLEGLKEKVDFKMRELAKIKLECQEIHMQNLAVTDHTRAIYRCQTEIRSLLNDIHEPSQRISQSAEELALKAKLQHEKRLAKLKVELDHKLASFGQAIENKIKNLTHEKQLHERTILTIKCRIEDEEKLRGVDKAIAKEKEIIDDNEQPEIIDMTDDQGEALSSNSTAILDDGDSDSNEEVSFTPRQAQRPNSQIVEKRIIVE